MPRCPLALAAPIAMLLTAAAAAADFDAAAYHEAQCTRCHDTSVYTRSDRRIRSLPALEAQVARCDANLGLKLFPDDLAVLVDHLNNDFYRFPR